MKGDDSLKVSMAFAGIDRERRREEACVRSQLDLRAAPESFTKAPVIRRHACKDDVET